MRRACDLGSRVRRAARWGRGVGAADGAAPKVAKFDRPLRRVGDLGLDVAVGDTERVEAKEGGGELTEEIGGGRLGHPLASRLIGVAVGRRPPRGGGASRLRELLQVAAEGAADAVLEYHVRLRVEVIGVVEVVEAVEVEEVEDVRGGGCGGCSGACSLPSWNATRLATPACALGWRRRRASSSVCIAFSLPSCFASFTPST